jgi:hypothetical protein
MKSSFLRSALVALPIIAVGPAAHAQSPNPFKAAGEAFKKAMEETKRQAEAQLPAQPAQPATGATQPVAGVAQPSSQTPGSTSVLQTGDAPASVSSPQETARLAAAVSYLDVAGVKLGGSLAEAQKVLTATNPAFKFTPQVETPWPLRGGQPPPNAPKSVRNLHVEIDGGRSGGSEAFDLSGAEHPNPPVVILISRSIGFPVGGGPSFDNVVAGLRKKYGPESFVDPTVANNNTSRTFMAKWFFDERGQVLPGNLGAQAAKSGCDVGLQPTNTGLCGTLTILTAYVGASGAGVVDSMRVSAKSNPLQFSAQETTNAYLQQVEQDLARQQLQESSQRQVPKL